jgi:phytoene synthase
MPVPESLQIGESLAPVERVAVAYAPAASRRLWLGILALDARLAHAAKPGAEPVLAQIKLAWWRDVFTKPAADWPPGEPLLALLTAWNAEREALCGLVDGWEDSQIGEDGGIRLRAARVEAYLALVRLAGAGDPPDAVRRAVLDWQDGEPGGPLPRLSRTMRPLAVLRGLALRGEGGSAIGGLLTVMRAGLTGR